jgi:acetyl-CoA carboxylase carboxyl transferase subunit beta
MAVDESGQKKRVPHGLWTKCPKCEQIIYNKELAKNLKVCPKCHYPLRTSARERLAQLVDEGTFEEIGASLAAADPLGFVDTAAYADRIKESRKKTGERDAILAGVGAVAGQRVALAVLDFGFMGGSMGSVVGEKVTETIERAIADKIPALVVSASGGARMQEGILSLFQMAKTSAALGRLEKARLPFISLVTDPTTGGVTASFAMLGDVILAEPKALVAFAGPPGDRTDHSANLAPGFPAIRVPSETRHGRHGGRPGPLERTSRSFVGLFHGRPKKPRQVGGRPGPRHPARPFPRAGRPGPAGPPRRFFRRRFGGGHQRKGFRGGPHGVRAPRRRTPRGTLHLAPFGRAARADPGGRPDHPSLRRGPSRAARPRRGAGPHGIRGPNPRRFPVVRRSRGRHRRSGSRVGRPMGRHQRLPRARGRRSSRPSATITATGWGPRLRHIYREKREIARPGTVLDSKPAPFPCGPKRAGGPRRPACRPRPWGWIFASSAGRSTPAGEAFRAGPRPADILCVIPFRGRHQRDNAALAARVHRRPASARLVRMPDRGGAPGFRRGPLARTVPGRSPGAPRRGGRRPQRRGRGRALARAWKDRLRVPARVVGFRLFERDKDAPAIARALAGVVSRVGDGRFADPGGGRAPRRRWPRCGPAARARKPRPPSPPPGRG